MTASKEDRLTRAQVVNRCRYTRREVEKRTGSQTETGMSGNIPIFADIGNHS